MNLQEIPLEIQIRILKYCEISDIPQISSLNHYFNDISHDRTLWLSYCRRDFPTFEFGEGDIDFYEVYRSELYRYKNLVGEWTDDFLFNQAFVRIKLDKNALKVYGLHGFDNYEIFDIPWRPEDNKWGRIVCKMCHGGEYNAHSASIDIRNTNEFLLHCEVSNYSTLYFKMSTFLLRPDFRL